MIDNKSNNFEDMSNKATEDWLLKRGFFVDCRKCDTRKEGCHKDCKFIKAYKERNKQ